MAILLEKTKGRLPFWLSPEQVRILTINDNVIEYAEQVRQELESIVLNQPVKYNEIRASLDKRSESLGKKIREATLMKVPLIIIVGEKDKNANQVSLRDLDGNETKINRSELEDYINTLV
jgi:threonyl-tRNA synthetase